jgi:hypothetical protein
MERDSVMRILTKKQLRSKSDAWHKYRAKRIETSRVYNLKKKEEHKEYYKKYYLTHREEIMKRTAEYYKRNLAENQIRNRNASRKSCGIEEKDTIAFDIVLSNRHLRRIGELMSDYLTSPSKSKQNLLRDKINLFLAGNYGHSNETIQANCKVAGAMLVTLHQSSK